MIVSFTRSKCEVELGSRRYVLSSLGGGRAMAFGVAGRALSRSDFANLRPSIFMASES